MLYTFIPKEKILEKDNVNMQGKTGDNLTTFIYQQYENYGYIDFIEYRDYCRIVFGSSTSPEYLQAVSATSGSQYDLRPEYLAYYQSRGYTVKYYNISGKPFVYKDRNPFQMLGNFARKLITFDNPNAITDDNNPNLERKVYIGKDWNGVPAVMCSGCTHKYLLYFDNKFPFIHQNWIKINLGRSYPTYSGNEILSVITADTQGNAINHTVTFPTGVVAQSPILEHSCTYKPSLDVLDVQRFTDNYAACSISTTGFSMMGTSFVIGIFAFLLAYFIGLPAGLLMAKSKGRLFDKVGIAYIIFIIAVPSLVYIFMFQRIGGLFGLPMKFAMLGETAIASYVLPTISLALPSAAGLMMWIRRYMIDQASADYVKFARSKGLSEFEIFKNHIMRNAIIPIVHAIPAGILGALVGAIITERVYAVPGMGKMLTDAINSNNNAMIVGLTLIFTLLSVLSVILGDIFMAMADPRISYESGGRK
jgi:oligopeptide transport system permease protein